MYYERSLILCESARRADNSMIFSSHYRTPLSKLKYVPILEFHRHLAMLQSAITFNRRDSNLMCFQLYAWAAIRAVRCAVLAHIHRSMIPKSLGVRWTHRHICLSHGCAEHSIGLCAHTATSCKPRDNHVLMNLMDRTPRRNTLRILTGRFYRLNTISHRADMPSCELRLVPVGIRWEVPQLKTSQSNRGAMTNATHSE